MPNSMSYLRSHDQDLCKLDIHTLIKQAKLGGARKDAQIDTCAVFSAALFDHLNAIGLPCRMFAVAGGFYSEPEWWHSLVEVSGRYYDSLGEFSEEIWRKRAKIHPKVSVVLKFKPDAREGCYEAEFDELHIFYLTALRKAYYSQLA